jgi:hypothetical protein
MSEMNDSNFQPVLLSKSELYFVLGNINVSKSFEYKIRSSIRKKIQTLTELELPLLVKSNFFVNNDHNRGVDDDNSRGRGSKSRPRLSCFVKRGEVSSNKL